jgi:Matrixin
MPKHRLLTTALLATALGLLTTAATVILIAIPASAAAATRTAKAKPATSPIALAVSIAERYWGAVPCNGQINIVTQQPIPTVLQHDSDAWVTFNSSLGANNLAAPAASYTNCTVALGNHRWPTTVSMRQDWDMLCMTMTHEFGHLLGHPHDTTPGSVMNPVFTNYSSEPQLCKTHRPSAPRR